MDGEFTVLNYCDKSDEFFQYRQMGEGRALSKLEMDVEDCKGCDGLILLYDTTSRESFTNLHNYINALDKLPQGRPPLVLCGSKCDLESEWNVSVEEGRNMGKFLNAPFFQISSKTHFNVYEAFFELVRQIRAREGRKSEGNSPPGNKKCAIM